jgi:hypothetical protein
MTMRNDLQERVAGFVYACPDIDLMKLDIDALAKRGRRPQPLRGCTRRVPPPYPRKSFFLIKSFLESRGDFTKKAPGRRRHLNLYEIQ